MISISDMTVEGVGCITNISLSNQEHSRIFFQAADWFVRSQDESGGWPNQVVFNKDKSKYAGADEIQPGWYSAMAQGHGISILTRAFAASGGEESFLNAAEKALELYRVPSSEGGFVAKFMDQHVWYEEYPTNPPTFVLNGFMYSLLGLYDLKDLLENYDIPDKEKVLEEVTELFEIGMKSLKIMLPLYDTGSGTVYDLRHFTMKSTEPKIARWDYHSTHVNLLYVLSSVDLDPVLSNISKRWKNYMLGKRAKHN